MANENGSWKDADSRAELSDEERALMPENPAGATELTDEALEEASGGSCLCWSCNESDSISSAEK